MDRLYSAVGQHLGSNFRYTHRSQIMGTTNSKISFVTTTNSKTSFGSTIDSMNSFDTTTNFGTTTFPIHFKSLRTCSKVRTLVCHRATTDGKQVSVPNLPLSYLTGHGNLLHPYSDYVNDLIAWKKEALPLQDGKPVLNRTLKELAGLQMVFPAIDNSYRDHYPADLHFDDGRYSGNPGLGLS